MKFFRILAVLMPMFLAGCASTGQTPSQWACAAAGAIVGGAGAAIADGDEEAAIASAAVGAALGYIACNRGEAKPEPAPAPEPAPKPMADPDTDGDGVLDKHDKCPGTAQGTPVDSDGCPKIPSLTGVHFDYDKAAITAAGQSILDDAIVVLTRNPHVGVNIVGHTDSRGSDEYNQRLSQQRAESVQNYLAAGGIAKGRMRTAGRGESDPVASNDTDSGRAQNRRVDVTAFQL